MNKHIQMVHDNITPYHCQAFKSKAGLESHMGRVHEGKKYEFKCEMCPKILATAVSLKGHIEAVHEKKRPFVCDICNAAFGGKGNLKTHTLRVHEGGRPFECHRCDKSYTSKQILDGHIERDHEGKKPKIMPGLTGLEGCR